MPHFNFRTLQVTPNQIQDMRRANIDVTKIDKTKLYKGAKGTYLDITLMENKGGTDEFGNDGFIIQDIGKEARDRGEKGPIIGNWRRIETKGGGKPKPENKPAAQDDDRLPF